MDDGFEKQQQAKAALAARQSGEQQSRILAQLKKGEDATTKDTSPSEFELNFSGRSELPHLNKNVRRRQKGAFQKLMREKASLPGGGGGGGAAAPATSSRPTAATTRQKSNKQHPTKMKRRDLFPGIDEGTGDEGAGGGAGESHEGEVI